MANNGTDVRVVGTEEDQTTYTDPTLVLRRPVSRNMLEEVLSEIKDVNSHVRGLRDEVHDVHQRVSECEFRIKMMAQDIPFLRYWADRYREHNR